MSEVTAVEAYAHAQEAHLKVEAHEDLCAERYLNIQEHIKGVKDSVGTLLKVVAGGGSLLFTTILGLLAFFATRAVNTNDAEVQALKVQVQMLQTQDLANHGSEVSQIGAPKH